MVILFLIVFGFYFLAMLALLYGWESALQQSTAPSSFQDSITVIVPFRNEQNHLKQLIASLSKQNYPRENFEVILVNDHSTDAFKQQITDLPYNFLAIDLDENSFGKKAAITHAVELAKGNIIATTDADCQHNPEWLLSINHRFANSALQLLVGPVSIDGRSFFSVLQSIEFSSLIGSGAALLTLGKPTMANGANLAFRKSAFLKVNGYEGNAHIASGDDEFLLRKIHKAFPKGMAFNNSSYSTVVTEPLPNLVSFFQQRLRWASKWKHNSSFSTRFTAVLVFLFQLSFLAMLAMAIASPNRANQIITLAKLAIDGIFLWRVSTFLKSKFSIFPFLVLQLVYPVYVIVIALLSQFVSYKWKDRVPTK